MVEAKVILSDAFEAMKDLGDKTVSAVITDPPYFLEGMGDSWDKKTVDRETTKKQAVSSLRAGMKFDKQQGKDFQNFMEEIARLALPKLKPGGWFVSFSAPRLYHRLAVGVEDAGFEVRDMWEWLYTQNQMKAMSVSRSIKKDDFTKEELISLKEELLEWKTPQVRSCFEPIVLAQKPREGTFYNNWVKYRTGLVRVKPGIDSGLSTANVISTENISEVLDRAFLVSKPGKNEKGNSSHLSVKPLALMQHLIEVLVPEGGVVVDPFNGSGTTGIAALRANRAFYGFENNEKYFLESFERMNREFATVLGEGEYVSDSTSLRALF